MSMLGPWVWARASPSSAGGIDLSVRGGIISPVSVISILSASRRWATVGVPRHAPVLLAFCGLLNGLLAISCSHPFISAHPGDRRRISTSATYLIHAAPMTFPQELHGLRGGLQREPGPVKFAWLWALLYVRRVPVHSKEHLSRPHGVRHGSEREDGLDVGDQCEPHASGLCSCFPGIGAGVAGMINIHPAVQRIGDFRHLVRAGIHSVRGGRRHRAHRRSGGALNVLMEQSPWGSSRTD